MVLFIEPKALFCVAALGIFIGGAHAQDGRQNAPGQFDYYVLSLSWSPSFCETATGNARRQQCGARPYSFVVHGLWPQYERGFPEFCLFPPPRLDRNIMRSMLDLMPAPGLVYHEWDQHGTCSGLQPREYFDVVRRAREKVEIPEQFSHPTVPLSVTPSQVMNAFVSANDGLSPNAITIDCGRGRLREVRICFTRDLKFRDCSLSAQRACRSERVIMPPVRGEKLSDLLVQRSAIVERIINVSPPATWSSDKTGRGDQQWQIRISLSAV
jgi:ribonuclease T2